MAQTIQIKRNNSNAATKPSSLLVGELAGNLLDRSLFSSDGSSVFQFYTGTNKWFDTSGNANNANKLGGIAASSYLTSHQDISHLLSKNAASKTYQTIINTSNKLPFDYISGKPTTLSGYGITDAAVAGDLTSHITAFNTYKTATDKRLADLEGYWYIDDNGNLHTTYNIVSDKDVVAGGEYSGGSGGGGATGLGTVTIKTVSGQEYKTDSNGVVTIPDYQPKGNYLTAIPTEYITESELAAKGYLTGITSAMVTTALGYVPFNSTSFTKATIKSTLGIADWALAASKPSYSWSEVTGKPSFATVATSGKYSDLSGVPTSLPASDVYAWAKAATKPTYTASEVGALPLSGGAMQGDIVLPSGYYIRTGNSWNYAMLGVDGDKVLVGTHDYHTQIRSNTTPTAVIGGAEYTFYHTGNFNPSNYLPLSGGTISVLSREPLKLNNTVANSSCYIPFSTNGVVKAYVGWSINGYAFLQGPNNNYIAIQADGANYNGNTLIHSGNIGSQSVDRAIALRGIYPSVTSTNDFYNTEQLIKYHAGFSPDFGNVPSSTSWKNGLLEIGLHSAGASAQFFFSAYKRLYYRSHQTDAWHGVAYLTDNVASATKLQTARTIWGNSFDGTGNVDGNLILGYNKIYLANGNDNYYLGWNGSTQLVFKNYYDIIFSTSTERMRITNEGNIIVGKGSYLSATDASDTARGVLELTTSQNRFLLGYGIASAGYDTSLQGNNIEFTYGTAHTVGMKLNSNGNVLIGTTTDNGGKLQVKGRIKAVGEWFENDVAGVGLYNSAGDARWYWNSAKGWYSDKAVYISGNLTVTGDGVFGSDARYKSKLQDLAVDVETIANAPVFSYKWTDREDDRVHLGTTAQYWLPTKFCDAVDTSNPNFYHLNYGALGVAIGVTVAKKVVNHEERIKELEERVKNLEIENKQLRQWHN